MEDHAVDARRERHIADFLEPCRGFRPSTMDWQAGEGLRLDNVVSLAIAGIQEVIRSPSAKIALAPKLGHHAVDMGRHLAGDKRPAVGLANKAQIFLGEHA